MKPKLKVELTMVQWAALTIVLDAAGQFGMSSETLKTVRQEIESQIEKQLLNKQE